MESSVSHTNNRKITFNINWNLILRMNILACRKRKFTSGRINSLWPATISLRVPWCSGADGCQTPYLSHRFGSRLKLWNLALEVVLAYKEKRMDSTCDVTLVDDPVWNSHIGRLLGATFQRTALALALEKDCAFKMYTWPVKISSAQSNDVRFLYLTTKSLIRLSVASITFWKGHNMIRRHLGCFAR